MDSIFGLSNEIWSGAILGAVLSAIVIPLIWAVMRWIRNWLVVSRPRRQVLGPLAIDEEMCTLFVRDFFLSDNSQILAVEPTLGVSVVPNVRELWADVDARGIAYALNALGQVNKRRNIHIMRMSQDSGIWNTHIIIIGAQSQKSFDFYQRLAHVMYRVDADEIRDATTNEIVPRDSNFGYGIVAKASNPYKTEGYAGVGFLIGGFGTLGTAAAAYYFREHLEDLGKQFGSRCFGIVVRASVTAGEQTVERLREYDRIGPPL